MALSRVPNSEIFLANDENYHPKLARNYEGQNEELHLYCVIISSPLGVSSNHVLAPSEEDAIHQADDLSPELKKLTKFAAYRIPLRIRGWGKIEF